MRAVVVVAGLAAVAGLCLVRGHAQTLPSVEQMIDSLDTRNVARKCPPGTPCRGVGRVASTDEDILPGEAAPDRPAHHRPTVQLVTSGSGLLDLTVEFATNSADLTPSAERALTRLGQALASARLASQRFRIEGHTDTVGQADENQSLSEKRAASVAAFLENNGAIPAARLEPVGMGETGLAVPTGDQVAEAHNRRVHIVNLGS